VPQYLLPEYNQNHDSYAATYPSCKFLCKHLSDVSAAIKGGIQILQYRDKHPIDASYLAGALKELCHAANIPLIINDRFQLLSHKPSVPQYLLPEYNQNHDSYAATYPSCKFLCKHLYGKVDY
jgi:hypothetical protein